MCREELSLQSKTEDCPEWACIDSNNIITNTEFISLNNYFVRKYKKESVCYIFSLSFFSGLLSLSLKWKPRSRHSRAGLNGSHDFWKKN